MDKTRRIQSKGWFLTYPQCDCSKEELMAFFKTYPAYLSCVVAREKHASGDLHLHVFLKFVKKQSWSPTKFDYTNAKGDVYHGNYQAAKSHRAVETYIQKDGDYISDNVSANAFIIKYTNKEIMSMDPRKLCDDQVIHWSKIPLLVQSRNLYDLFTPSPYTHTNVRGIWIYGPPGVGKSSYAQTFLSQRYPVIYTKPQNKWWDGYSGQHAVLMEDVDSPALGHLLKIWLDRYPCVGECKGSSTHLQHRVFVITSNYTPEELWNKDEIDRTVAVAIRRRCLMVDMSTTAVPRWLPDQRHNVMPTFTVINLPEEFRLE